MTFDVETAWTVSAAACGLRSGPTSGLDTLTSLLSTPADTSSSLTARTGSYNGLRPPWQGHRRAPAGRRTAGAQDQDGAAAVPYVPLPRLRSADAWSPRRVKCACA
jgi:hypothetical protein